MIIIRSVSENITFWASLECSLVIFGQFLTILRFDEKKSIFAPNNSLEICQKSKKRRPNRVVERRANTFVKTGQKKTPPIECIKMACQVSGEDVD